MTDMRPVALVTGASGGIGEEMAKLLAAKKHDLVLVARSVDKLNALARALQVAHGVTAHVVAADLNDSGAPNMIAEAVRSKGLHIDVLVNNAGLGSYGLFSEIPVATDLGLVTVNITALTHLCKLFLPQMVARKRGYVLNVASTAAFAPGPLMAVYYASKAYVVSLSIALANEMKASGVVVSCLCPGPTRTGFDRVAGNDKTALFKGGGIMEAGEVASIGIAGLFAGKSLVVPGFKNRFLAKSSGLVPLGMLAAISRSLQEPAS